MKKLLTLLFLLLLPALVYGNVASGTITEAGASCTATTCVDLLFPPYDAVSTIEVAGTFTGTLQFETSVGSSWVSIEGTPFPSGAAASSTTSTGVWRFQTAGLTGIRVRASALSSGSADISIISTSGSTGGGGSSGGSSATEYSEDTTHQSGNKGVMSLGVQKTADGALGDDGDYEPYQLDETGNIKVAIKAGAGSGGTASTDDSTFSIGSGSGTPAMGILDDTDPDSVDEHDAGVVRMSPNRNWYIQIRDGAGNERSVNIDASNNLQVIDENSGTQTTHLSEIEGAVETLEGAVAGSEFQVDIIGALPAGTNNIGDVDLASALPAGTNNIGDVGVVTLPALPTGTNNIGDVDLASSLPAGSNNIGDVDVASLPSLPAGTNNIGDVDIVSALPTGSNTIGKVDIASALPTGSNAIGKLTANDGVDIGNVDLGAVDSAHLSEIEGAVETLELTKATISTTDLIKTALFDDSNNQITTFGGGQQYDEDATHTSGDTGTMALGVTKAADGAFGNDGDYAPMQFDGSGFLKVNIKAGAGSGGTASTDDGAFSIESGSGTPTMGLFDDTSPDSVDENDVGVVRMSGNRNLYGTIRDAAGNERGVNVDASNRLQVYDSGMAATVGGSEQQVDVVAELPAGTQNIGDVDVATIAAGDNNIGNVDIVTLPSGNLGQQTMSASLSVVPANNVTDATYIGDIKFGEALPTGSNAIGKLAANDAVDIGDVTVNNLTDDDAHDSPDTVDGVKVGLRAESQLSDLTPVSADGDKTNWFADRDGVALVRGMVPLGDRFQEKVAITGTTWTELEAPPGAGIYLCITGIHVHQSSTTVGANVDIYADDDGDIDSAVAVDGGYCDMKGGGWADNSGDGPPLYCTETANYGFYAVVDAASDVDVRVTGFKTKVAPQY